MQSIYALVVSLLTYVVNDLLRLNDVANSQNNSQDSSGWDNFSLILVSCVCLSFFFAVTAVTFN